MFTITITRFPQEGSTKWKIIQRKLERDLELTPERAEEVMRNPPFVIPHDVTNISQAASVAHSFTEHSCKVSYSHDEQKGGEMPQEEESALQPEPSPLTRLTSNPVAITIAAATLLLLVILYKLMVPAEVDSVEAVEQSAAEISKIKTHVSAIFDIPESRPLKPAIKRLNNWIERKKIHKITRNKLSTLYTKRSDAFLKLALKQNSLQRSPRKIEKFLRVAIAFNPKNRKAWKKLIEHYNRIGEASKAASTKLQMRKKLGDGEK